VKKERKLESLLVRLVGFVRESAIFRVRFRKLVRVFSVSAHIFTKRSSKSKLLAHFYKTSKHSQLSAHVFIIGAHMQSSSKSVS